MNIFVYDNISVSEATSFIYPPALYQGDLGIISGRTYRLSFSSLISSGILNVYQGRQLIYSSAIVFVGTAYSLFDRVRVKERVYISCSWNLDVSDTVTVSEFLYMNDFPLEISESVTISENVSLSII